MRFKTHHWLLLGATLLAAFLRIYQIDQLPPPAWYDEIWYGLRAREILQTGQLPIHYETSFGGANAGPVYMAMLSQLLGFDTLWGARVIPALVGALSVPLAYACLRELLRADRGHGLSVRQQRTAAALSAIVLSYTLFYVTIGRMGMENGLAPATALFVIWQMTRGAHRGAWSGWLLAGLVGGITQYNGLHARFVLPLMVIVFTQDFILAKPGDRLRLIKGGALLAAVGIAVSAPLSLFFLNNPEWFGARGSVVVDPYIGPGRPYATFGEMLRENLINILRVFSIEGSYDAKNGVPGLPLLDWAQAGGFYAGLVWVGLRLPRSAVARLLPLWLIITTLPSLLTEGAPNLGRMIGIAAPAAAIVALGWVWLFSLLPDRAALRRAATAAAVALILGSGAYHTYNLFVRWPASPEIEEAFTTGAVQATEDMLVRAERGTAFVQVAPEMPEGDIAAFEFVLPGTEVTRLDFRQCLPVPHQRDEPTSYLVLRERDEQTVDRLTQLYRSATIPQDGIDLFQGSGTVVRIPAGANAPRPPLRPQAEFGQGIGLWGYEWTGPRVQAGDPLLITLYWHTTQALDADLTAFAHLSADAEGQPLAQRDGQPCLGLYPTSAWQADEIVPDGFALEIPAGTPPGDYILSVGWYAFPSLEALPLLQADQAIPGERAVIGTVEVHAP